MSEQIVKQSLLSRLTFKLSEKNLLVMRKWLMLIAVLNVINAGLDYYTGGLSLKVLFSGFVALMLISFSAKCETLILKMRLEKMIDHQMVLE